MRPIKFRAYLKNEKKIIDVKSIDWDKNGNLISINYPEGKDYFGYENNDIVLMQYSGFKDINGKEIYEDDVIRFGGKLYEVRQMYSGFCIVRFGDVKKVAFNTEGMEVAGNLYEDPQLSELIWIQ